MQVRIFTLILPDASDYFLSVRSVVTPAYLSSALNTAIVFQSAETKIGARPVMAILADLAKVVLCRVEGVGLFHHQGLSGDHGSGAVTRWPTPLYP